MAEAIALEAHAQRAALSDDWAGARAGFGLAAQRYRDSWEAAPPASYGRLVGMLKAAVLAGSGADEAEYVQRALAEHDADSPTAAYALALAALIVGDDPAAARWAGHMRAGSKAFERAAAAICSLAGSDPGGYRTAVEAIVEDFAARGDHLTGVPIADTALMLERLAERRGLKTNLESPLLPHFGA